MENGKSQSFEFEIGEFYIIRWTRSYGDRKEMELIVQYTAPNTLVVILSNDEYNPPGEIYDDVNEWIADWMEDHPITKL